MLELTKNEKAALKAIKKMYKHPAMEAMRAQREAIELWKNPTLEAMKAQLVATESLKDISNSALEAQKIALKIATSSVDLFNRNKIERDSLLKKERIKDLEKEIQKEEILIPLSNETIKERVKIKEFYKMVLNYYIIFISIFYLKSTEK